jgi:starvation-inducible DNA-binding protein
VRPIAELPYRTANDLPDEARAHVATLLNECLADAVDLNASAKQAHWNVKGPHFIALHHLFDDIHTAVEGYVDLLAERVVQLGGIAAGTVAVASARTTLTQYPLDIVAGAEHADAMARVLAEFGSHMRRGIDIAADTGDQVSSDICTEIARGVDKWLWFVEAHGQSRQASATLVLEPASVTP